MIVRCWGVRGSIPVSGAPYLTYGGDTTCVEVRTRDGQTVILDAGTGLRRLGCAMLAEGRLECALIFTHAHWDHIQGLPFFRLLYHSQARIHVYGKAFDHDSLEEMVGGGMAAPYFPIPLDSTPASLSWHSVGEEPFALGSVTVTPVPLSHPNQGLGYRFEADGRAFVFLTDNELGHQHPGGLTRDDYVRFASHADLLLHDGEFTDAEYERTRTWGHSTYADALALARDAGVARLGLVHHNQERCDDALDRIVKSCVEACEAWATGPVCFAARPGVEIVV